MNIGICDDLLECREELKALLLSYAHNFNIIEFSSGEDLLSYIQTGNSLDLLFLDIYMEGINGIETAEAIRKSYKTLPIIFLTTSPDFALSAFSVRAVGYLLKPINAEELEGYLHDYCEKIFAPPSWSITTVQGEVSLPIDKIVYCEQRGNYGEIHMDDGKLHTVRMTFSEMNNQLSIHKGIVACGRSFLINLSFVRTMHHYELVLNDGSTLPIPRRAYNTLREAYLAFYKEGL